MFELRSSQEHAEAATISTPYDLLLGFVATLELVVGGDVIYAEVEFPIVELRVALERWCEIGLPRNENFEFESIESAEKGLVWIRWQDDVAGWRVGSVHQDDIALEVFTAEAVQQAVRHFMSEVDLSVERHYGLRVADLLAPFLGDS